MVPSILKQITGGFSIGVILLIPCFSQKTPTPPGGGGSTGSGTTTPRTTIPQPSPTPTPTYPDTVRGIYLSGKVVMEDGTPPPEPVTIERLCGSSPRAQAYTDGKGRFSFQMGQNNGVMPDASEDGTNFPNAQRSSGNQNSGMSSRQFGNPETRLAGCELRAALPGFRSDAVLLNGRRALDNPDVGTIVLHRLGNVDGTVISMTSLQAPNAAKKAYDKGRQALQKNKTQDAGKEFQKAVDIYPKYASAWYELGRIQEGNKDVEEARKSYANALAADSKFMSPYLQLADLAAREQNWRDLADTTDRLLRLDAVDYPLAHFYNAMANLNLGKNDAAEKSAVEGARLDTAHKYPKMEQAVATVLARKKDYAGAAEHLRNYLRFAPEASDAARIKVQLAELDRLAGANRRAVSQPESKDESNPKRED